MPSIPTERRTADIVYQRLRAELISGTLPAGERIDHDALVRDLNVSRTPIREAILRLEAEGFIEREPYRGAVVAMIDGSWVEEITALRLDLEGLAGRLAATRISEATLDEMEHLLHELDRLPPDNYAAFSDLNRQFHRLLYGSAGSSQLLRYLDLLADHAERIRNHYRLPRSPLVPQQHRAILHACRDHDPKRTEEEIRGHILVIFELMAGAAVADGIELQFLPQVLNRRDLADVEAVLGIGRFRKKTPVTKAATRGR